MKTNEKKSVVKSTFMFIGGIALAVTSMITLQPLIKKYSAKLYKASLKKDPIDFDNLGPELVKADTREN